MLIITPDAGKIKTLPVFSASPLFSRGQIMMGLVAVGLHVTGSLAMTGIGIYTFKLLKG